MILKKLTVASNASRNIQKLTSIFWGAKFPSSLLWRKKSWAGRTQGGRISLWTKSRLLRKILLPKINYSWRPRSVFFVAAFRLIPFSTKLITLIFLSSGGLLSAPTNSWYKFLGFHYPKFARTRLQTREIFANPYSILLFSIPRFVKISLFELYPGKGIQYARSSGSFGKLINFDWERHLVKVQLPSGVRKNFSVYSLASYGPVSLSEKKLVRNTKAGYYKCFGKKSLVRGVAMNPVDHPHGGRTKAIRYPRTPWGKTTKYK